VTIDGVKLIGDAAGSLGNTAVEVEPTISAGQLDPRRRRRHRDHHQTVTGSTSATT
jgi:hypothetical protein